MEQCKETAQSLKSHSLYMTHAGFSVIYNGNVQKYAAWKQHVIKEKLNFLLLREKDASIQGDSEFIHAQPIMFTLNSHAIYLLLLYPIIVIHQNYP